jgi:hypothetical protein
MTEVQERPPPFSNASMAGSLGGNVRGLKAPTTYLEDIDGGPLWGPTFIRSPKVCCDLHRQHR